MYWEEAVKENIMTNAKIELLGMLAGINLTVKCAGITLGSYQEESKEVTLLPDFNRHEWVTFLEELDVEYDSGYGLQELYGIVWLSDGAWLERHEYDGSENWILKSCPPIPDSMLPERPFI